MNWRTLLLIALLLPGLPALVAEARSAPVSETEAQLLARMQNEQNPVKKSKDATRLAGIKLKQAIQAYGEGNAEQGIQLIDAFMGRIKDSWQMLKNSGRNAGRDPRGFRELDIELREDIRQLDDLKRRISYYDREPIDKTMNELEQIRSEVLQALFPGAQIPKEAKPFVGSKY